MGYYGFGNLGDEMILGTIRSFLEPHRVIAFPTAFLPTEDALDRLNSFDYLILGGGGLFNRSPAPPFDTFDQWASGLQTPISVLGLGVEQLDSCFIPAVHHLVERADFFIVRDVESMRLIGHPKVQVAPDLTFYQPLSCSQFSQNGQEPIIGVNLRPLHQGVTEWVRALSVLPGRKLALPFSVVPTYDDREPLAQVVAPCSDQASLADYQRLDIVVGTAFHSIVFAVQAGVPAIAINYHPKVRRLMEELGLASLVLEWDEPERLPACYEKALAERDAIRAHMLDYTRRAQQTLTRILAEVREDVETQTLTKEIDNSSVVTEPTVSVFVLCGNASESDIAKTLASCRNQTYTRVELVLVDCPEGLWMERDVPTGLQNVDTVEADVNKSDLFAGSGEYVTWVAGGAWFAEDALALLLRSLVKRPDAVLAHSNYFLTSNGNIERKIELGSLQTADSLPVGPSFLARRDAAAALWRAYGPDDRDRSGNAPVAWRTVHLTQPLLHMPATESERLIYLAAIAVGRGRLEAARGLAAQAIALDPDLAGPTPAFEQGFRAFLDAGFNRLVVSSPTTYLADVCAALPADTQAERSFARRYAGRSQLELAFIHYQQGELRRTRSSLLNAFRHDPVLLSNRGALWLLAETVLGRTAIETLRGVRRKWR